MINRWRTLFRLSSGDKLLLGRAAWYLLVFVVALRVLGAGRAIALSRARAVPRAHGAHAAPDFPARAGLALDRVRGVFGIGTCLSRSLALRRLLASAGIETALRIGTRPRGPSMEAHAWVEPAAGADPVNAAGTGYRPFAARL